MNRTKSPSINLSSQVTVSACQHTNPPTDLSFMNQKLGHLFGQESQERATKSMKKEKIKSES